ncbi:MAG TPA: hypothetical protein VFO52_15515 [Longimicrobiales bacterium]|nr:hypothetical protein [Longimicrobiales bacterium]
MWRQCGLGDEQTPATLGHTTEIELKESGDAVIFRDGAHHLNTTFSVQPITDMSGEIRSRLTFGTVVIDDVNDFYVFQLTNTRLNMEKTAQARCFYFFKRDSP